MKNLRKIASLIMAMVTMTTAGMSIGAGAQERVPDGLSISAMPSLPSGEITIEPVTSLERNITTGPNITYIKAHPFSDRSDGLYGNELFYADMALPGYGNSLATLSLSKEFLDVASSFDANVWYVTVEFLISGTGLMNYETTRNSITGSSVTESFDLPSNGTYRVTYSYWVNDFYDKTRCGVSVFHYTPYGTSSSVAGARIVKQY